MIDPAVVEPTFQRLSRRADRAEAASAASAADKLSWPVVLFMIGIIVPWIIPIGSLNLSVYRLTLLVALIPCLMMWLHGQAGAIRVADIAIIAYCVWATISLVVLHGVVAVIEPVGMLFIETLGAYFLARCYIRTAGQFRAMVTLASRLVLFLAPLALLESLTASKPILTIFGLVLPTVDIDYMMPRYGFWRVQGPFPHSILFGVYCGSTFALAYLVARRDKGPVRAWIVPAVMAVTSALSLSSAAIASIIIQTALLTYNAALKSVAARWKILCGLAVTGYLVIEFGSNQSPMGFYISHFTFDGQSAWYRLAIWEYGLASVAEHPIFGIGSGEYVRPSWMASASVDNFWLVIAMVYGLPALAMLGLACLSLGVNVRKANPQDDDYRLGYAICLAAFFFVGCTVHFWAAAYAWFFFLLGSGAWMVETPVSDRTGEDSRHSRFNRNDGRRGVHRRSFPRTPNSRRIKLSKGPVPSRRPAKG